MGRWSSKSSMRALHSMRALDSTRPYLPVTHRLATKTPPPPMPRTFRAPRLDVVVRPAPVHGSLRRTAGVSADATSQVSAPECGPAAATLACVALSTGATRPVSRARRADVRARHAAARPMTRRRPADFSSGAHGAPTAAAPPIRATRAAPSRRAASSGDAAGNRVARARSPVRTSPRATCASRRPVVRRHFYSVSAAASASPRPHGHTRAAPVSRSPHTAAFASVTQLTPAPWPTDVCSAAVASFARACLLMGAARVHRATMPALGRIAQPSPILCVLCAARSTHTIKALYSLIREYIQTADESTRFLANHAL